MTAPTLHYLQQLWTPAVAVCTSPAANELCLQQNGLTFAELLRPFGILRQLNGTVGVPVRTTAEHPLRLHSWALRFYDAATMFQPAPEAADSHLREVLAAAAADASSSEVLDVAELTEQVRGGGDPTPWYSAYHAEFLRLLAFGEHEAVDHPLACLLVLPADQQGDLVAAFKELRQQQLAQLPALAGGLAEPRLLIQHVLLHDAAAMGEAALEGMPNKLHYLSSVLSSTVHLLTINSAAAAGDSPGSPGSPRPAMPPAFWSALLRPTLAGGGAGEPGERPPAPAHGLGGVLSRPDVEGLSQFVQELAVRGLIPHMEARIRSLSQHVASTRKGLRNQLRSLLWRKGSGGFSAAAAMGSLGSLLDAPQAAQPATPPTAAAADAGAAAGGGASNVTYPHSTVEAQMRQLADLALMLGDTETATGTLRLLASDFKGDKAYRHYAGVQEALGAAAVLAGAPPADAAAHWKEALYRYQQLAARDPRARYATRYATRVAVVLAGFMRGGALATDANWVYMKAHYAEGDLRAGLLLEQAALCLLAPAAPHVRKFAFQMVLAGLRYNMCGQKGLALRAYKQVLGTYSGRDWGFIEEHLHDVLGKQSREAGDLPATVAHFMAMLRCERNSLHCQRLYLAQFFEAVAAEEAERGHSPVLELPLPEVGLERVGLQYDGQTCYAGVEARQVPSEAWRPLEAAVQPQAEAGAGPLTWLDGSSRAALEPQRRHSCCVGEVVGLDVELRNPLQVDLAITRLRLACTFEPAAGGGVAAEGPTSPGGAGAAAAAGFQVREESITLRAGERVMVHLRVVPLRPGVLEVGGVAWTLGGVARGLQRFRIPRPRPLKPGTSRVMLDAEAPPPGGVTLKVLPPMPRMEAVVEGLEPTLLAGELVRTTLRLRNTGAMTLQGLAMAAGTDGIYLASPGGGDAAGDSGGSAGGNGTLEQLSQLQLDTTSSGQLATGADVVAVEVTYAQRQGVPTFSLPPKLCLAVGQELELPIWFRAARPGPTRFSMAWYYEPLVRADSLRWRTLRSSHSVVALPSLHLAAGALAGTPGMPPGACLLQLQVGNSRGQESFRLTRLSCPDGGWHLHSLHGVRQAEQPPVALAAPPSSSSSSEQLDMQVPPDSSATLHFVLQPLPIGTTLSPSVPGAELHLYEQGRPMNAAPPPATQDAKQQRQQQQVPSPQQWKQAGAGAPALDREPTETGELTRPLDLLLQWEARGAAGSPPRQGYHVLYRHRVRAGPPIHCQLAGPPGPLHHDFSQAPFCVVPLTLLVHNTLGAPATVCVEAGHADGRSTSLGLPTWADAPPAATAADGSGGDSSPTQTQRGAAAGAAAPAQPYAWCGRTRVTLPRVGTGETAEVALQVAALVPGQLVLGDYRVSWQYPSAPQLTGSVAGPPCYVRVDRA
eukprot:scaffold8.g1561.t1